MGLTGDMANRHEQAASYLKSKREEGEKGRGRLKRMGKLVGGKVRKRQVKTLMVMGDGGRREDAAACVQTVWNAAFLPCARPHHMKHRFLLC